LILLGYGKTTKAIAKYFNIDKIYDDKNYDDNIVVNFSQFPKIIDKNESIIPTPAIPPNHQIIKRFPDNIISEYDLFYKNGVFPFSIWISGTNGKTTTTEMVTHLLNHRFAVSGGNIGIPLGELKKEASIWVLETSSFTLHYTKIAKPNIYVLLPITEDHISWHGTFLEYENSKLKPIRQLEEGEVAIVPYKYKDIETDGYLITYKDSEDLAKQFDLDISKIEFLGGFLLDALLSLTVSKIVFDEVDYQKINSFKKSFHRQEVCLDSLKRIWINDSKATNPDSTISLLNSFSKTQRIFLIIGGEDKGANWNPLFKIFQTMNIKLFAIGKSQKKVKILSKRYKITYQLSKTIDKAVQDISKEHNLESIATLSPSSASFDQFKSYEDRGNYFKRLICETE